MKKNLTIFIFLLFALQLNAQNYPYQSDVLWVTRPNNTNWLYQINEEAKVTVGVYKYGILQGDSKITYCFGPEQMPAEKTGFVILKNGQVIIPIGTMNKPGFKDLQLSIQLNGETYKHHIKLGFEPEKLQTLEDYDVVNFAKLIKVPVFMT